MKNLKKAVRLNVVLAALFFLFSNIALATTTSIINGSNPLLEADGILADYYGPGNLSRIDDDFDQIWMTSSGFTVTGLFHFACDYHEFGWFNSDGTLDWLLSTSGSDLTHGAATYSYSSFSGTAPSPSSTYANNFYLQSTPTTNCSGNCNDQEGTTLQWFSQSSNNSDGFDHMVTWLITGGQHYNADEVNYVIAWEDRPDGDWDYNDLVIQVTNAAPVPEPATLLLLGSGIICLAFFRRKTIQSKKS